MQFSIKLLLCWVTVVKQWQETVKWPLNCTVTEMSARGQCCQEICFKMTYTWWGQRLLVWLQSELNHCHWITLCIIKVFKRDNKTSVNKLLWLCWCVFKMLLNNSAPLLSSPPWSIALSLYVHQQKSPPFKVWSSSRFAPVIRESFLLSK